MIDYKRTTSKAHALQEMRCCTEHTRTTEKQHSRGHPVQNVPICGLACRCDHHMATNTVTIPVLTRTDAFLGSEATYGLRGHNDCALVSDTESGKCMQHASLKTGIQRQNRITNECSLGNTHRAALYMGRGAILSSRQLFCVRWERGTILRRNTHDEPLAERAVKPSVPARGTAVCHHRQRTPDFS